MLSTPEDSEVLTWADGSPVGFRISAPIPNGNLAQILLQKAQGMKSAAGIEPADRARIKR